MNFQTVRYIFVWILGWISLLSFKTLGRDRRIIILRLNSWIEWRKKWRIGGGQSNANKERQENSLSRRDLGVAGVDLGCVGLLTSTGAFPPLLYIPFAFDQKRSHTDSLRCKTSFEVREQVKPWGFCFNDFLVYFNQSTWIGEDKINESWNWKPVNNICEVGIG